MARTARYVASLEHRSALDPTVSGGKGAALARLIGAGLPVPGGFVVTTQAFADACAPILREIERTLDGLDSSDLPALERACRAARERVLGQRLPREIDAAIRRGCRRLGASPVAVRSSATAEDMPGASFAGQYDSFLNVYGAEAVLDRTRDVWASLYSARAVSYRRRREIGEASLRMAVVVQRVLPAESAGVLFTRDPLSGAEEQYLVNAALGLGEGVVDGSVPVDSFTIDAKTGDVVAREVKRKRHMIALAAGGGLRRSEVTKEQHDQPSLSDEQLTDLAALARSVQELFGGHQDIEFAAVAGSIQLLQARPVTAIEPAPEFKVTWDDPADAKHSWILANWTGRPNRRLEEDIRGAYAEGSKVCFEKTGSPMARNHIFHAIDGFTYARAPEVAEAEVGKRLKRYSARGQKLLERRTSLWQEVLRPPVDRRLRRLRSFRARGATLGALVRHLGAAIDAFGHTMGDLHWRMAGASIIGRREWHEVYHEITGEPAVDSGVYVQAVENKTTRMVRWMRNLARIVQSDRPLRRAFADRAYGRISESPLRDRPAVRRFRARFRNFLRRHGRRTGMGFGSATDLATPTWGMRPELPLAIIGAFAQQDLDAMARLEREARRERRRATARIRRVLAGDADRLARFELALFVAQEQVRMMENHNHMMEQATGGALREASYWVGQRLVRDGLLDDPDDVFHLSFGELKEFAAGRGPADVPLLVKERQEEFERRSRMRPPRTIGEGKAAPFDPAMRWEAPANTGRDGMLIRGVAASRGKITGKARIAPPSATPPHVEKGDILVAQNAGPNWTPVFPLIGALVLDEGAVFQHAALVAREYRIPAVIMTRDGTAAIRDGQAVTVDGDEGIVELSP